MNVGLRAALDLYAQVRPCKSYAGVRSRYEDVDLIVVRENTEDLYAGVEFEEGTEDADELLDWLAAQGLRQAPPRLRDLDQADLRDRHAPRSSSSPSTMRAATAAARSRPCTRRTS